MTEDESANAVELLLSSYPMQRQRMSREDARAMTAVYAPGLADLDFEVAKRAITALVLTEQWMPTIAAIRAMVTVMTEGRARPGGDAWGDVRRAIGRWGYARTPGVEFSFADPIVARCVSAFGWGELCNSENATADRARFVDMYDRLARESSQDRLIAGALPAAATMPALPGGTRALVADFAKALADKTYAITEAS